METVSATASSAPARALRSSAGAGASTASSRLPVRRVPAKRPAAGLEAAVAAVPEPKRARSGGAGGGGSRAPLKALSVTAVGRTGRNRTPAAPRRAPTVAGTQRAGAPPAAAAAPPAGTRSKRPAWDLRGQVSDLRVALEGSRERGQGLQRENRQLQEQLRESRSQESSLREQLQSLSSELERSRQQQEQQQQQLGALRQQLQDLEQERQRLQQAQARAQAQAEEQGRKLQQCQAQLEQTEASLQAQTSLAAQLQAQAQAQQQLLGQQGEKLQQQEEKLYQLEVERRYFHNLVQELKGNIRVFCRVRPLLPEEEERQQGLEHLHFPPSDDTTLVLCKPDEAHPGRQLRYDFSFDKVFPPGASQEQVFSEISLLVQSALDGYHVCIFAYGQTGSGKTYTMEGPDSLDPSSRGLIPRAMAKAFQEAEQLASKGWQYHFSASFLEIYNESLRDLLGPAPERAAEPLEIRRVGADSEELHVPGLRRVPVGSEAEVLALLETASAHRVRARTVLNDRSSRSHCVFQLHIQGSHPGRDLQCSSVLSLVDLAGSERLKKSSATGERLRETQAINASLSSLALVITALCNKEAHIPYRNSKLTYLLQNSLKGSAKMLMFVNVSPLEENIAESLNSLRFASKVNECVVGTARANRK